MGISFFLFVTIHAFDGQTDGRTDKQTDRHSLIAILRLQSPKLQRGKKLKQMLFIYLFIKNNKGALRASYKLLLVQETHQQMR